MITNDEVDAVKPQMHPTAAHFADMLWFGREADTWCSAGNLLKVDVLANLLAPGMHLQDSDTPLNIWPVNCDLHQLSEI